MYHQHPVGRHFIQVCTTSPCNVCGAEAVVDAFLKHTGCQELGQTSPDGKYTVIEVECLGACGFATPIMINEDFIESVTPETRAGDSPGTQIANGISAHSHTRVRSVVLSKYFGDREAITLDGWKKRGGYMALQKALGMSPGDIVNDRQGLRAARSRRRRISDRREVVVHEAGRRQAALPLLQRRRVRAGHVQGSRNHALDAARPRRGVRDRRVRDRRRDVLHLHSRRVHRADRARRGGAQGGYAAGILGKNAMGTGKTVNVYVHRGAGAYICGEETAMMNSIEGKSRQSAHQAAVPGGVGRVRAADDDQQRRDAGRGAAHPEQRRRVVQAVDARRQPEEHRHQALLGVRQRAAPGQLRSADGLSVQGFPIRPLRRSAAGPKVQGDHPGRHLGADSDASKRPKRASWTTRASSRKARCSAPAA